MLKKTFVFIFSLIALSSIGQTTQVPTPEFTDQPYIWLKESNELVELTKEIADMKSGGMSLKAKYKYYQKNHLVSLSAQQCPSLFLR